jgi:hypothetical protein
MILVNESKVSAIKEALETLEKLSIPDHLQEVAFQYLLVSDDKAPSTHGHHKGGHIALPATHSTTHGLREYIGLLDLKTAVAEIPALLYWAMTNEQIKATDENGVLELYRRAGLRPPKNIAQSLRDLSSKRYGRLEAISGQQGFIKLSRVGEDFVIHDLLTKTYKKG